MNLEGKYITLRVIEEKGEGRGDLEGILLSNFELGGVSFLRLKKRLINTGLVRGIDYDNNILRTETSTYKIEVQNEN